MEKFIKRCDKQVKINPLKKSVVFQVIDWVSLDIPKNSYAYESEDEEEDFSEYSTFKNPDDHQFGIRMYGVRKDGVSVSVTVKGFRPYFYIKVPEKWTDTNVGILKNCLKWSVPNCYRNSLLECKLLRRHKFYWFSNNKKFNYVRLSFNNISSFYKYRKILREPINYGKFGKKRVMKFPLYESNLEPYLRYIHIRDILPSGWIKIKRGTYETNNITKCQIDIKTEWDKVIKINENSFAPMVFASFDIECTSEDGSFPKADRDGDKIIQIGTTFHRYGENECCYKHIITLDTCSSVKGTDVESYKNEKALLMAWTKLINDVDPDVITGYNIWGFDFAYLHDRAVKLGCWKNFGKI